MQGEPLLEGVPAHRPAADGGEQRVVRCPGAFGEPRAQGGDCAGGQGSDPVFAARAERVRDPFTQLALPQAALRLKQGFGRLIRRSTDRGAVVILDNRILGRDYGKTFLQVLPPASRYVGPGSGVSGRVGGWLDGA